MNLLLVHRRHRKNLIAIVVAAERDPQTIAKSTYGVGLVTESDTMDQLGRIDADADSCTNFLVLGRLLIDIDLDVFCAAVIVDRQSRAEPTDPSANDGDVQGFFRHDRMNGREVGGRYGGRA